MSQSAQRTDSQPARSTTRYPRVDACPIDIYIPSNMPYEYPYKLGKPSYAKQYIRESAETYILDSGIGDDVTNAEVLDTAHDLDADFVVAKDVLHDREQTTANITEFLSLYDDHPCRATPMLPLQPDHVDHYDDLPANYAYLLGGVSPSLSDNTIGDIISTVEAFREAVGHGPYLHLLGVGANPRLADWLARNPDAVQSIDVSTPEQCAIKNQIYDIGLRQQDYKLRTGDGSSQGRYKLAEHLAYLLNDSIVHRMKEEKTTLGEWC